MNNRSETINAITKFLFIGKPDEMLKRYDLVIVLGSNLIELTIDEVSRLYRKGVIMPDALIILAGKVGTLNQGQEEAEANLMLDHAIRLGIPKDNLRIEPLSTNLYENYLLSKEIVVESGGFSKYKAILSVGQAFSLRRAKMSAARCGYLTDEMDFVGIVDRNGRNIAPDSWWTSEIARTRVIEELSRIATYTLKGDLSID